MSAEPERVLSRRQRAILQVIADYWREHGIAPTVRDVARLAGCAVSSASYQIGELEAAGLVTRRPNTPRSLRLAERPAAPGQGAAA